MSKALLYLRTARHLTPSQLYYWPLRKLQGTWSSSPQRVDGTVEGEWPKDRVVAWGPGDPDARLRRAADVEQGIFCFLNHIETLPRIRWSQRHVNQLWNYNLHYFDYALDLAWASRISNDRRFVAHFGQLAKSWIEETRLGVGDGWDPYVISVRTTNWIYALGLVGNDLDVAARRLIWESIASQLDHLERRMEVHLGANHLQRNYRALLVGGLTMSGARADQWIDQGSEGLWRALREQVLSDGGHFERSPMYHAIALTDFLEAYDLAVASGRPTPDWVVPRLAAMVDVMGVLSRPDGDLHLFNDASNGITPTRARIAALASLILGRDVPNPEGGMQLTEMGYFGFADSRSGERLLVDCGKPGPVNQPGHAHCDLLSFEWDFAGQRIVVDSGTSGYAESPLREYDRSTRAHNTVVVDGLEQSEVWATFRMARRARPQAAESRLVDDKWQFKGAYRPYHSRSGTHQRTIERPVAGQLRVTDALVGFDGSEIESFIHFHPRYEISVRDQGIIATAAGHPTIRADFFGVDSVNNQRGGLDPAQSWFSSEFGRSEASTVLVLRVAKYDGRSFGYNLQIQTP